jgi:ADP-ribosylglycohydrolase
MERVEQRPHRIERALGCLLGGALGDALGAPVEFMQLSEIRRELGTRGVVDLMPAYGRVGAITDDTQMTLFTAEGLIRARARWMARGVCDEAGVLHHALLRWLHTQGYRSPAMPPRGEPWPDGWLAQQRELFSSRAPGMTCLSALKMSAHFGQEASNDSKGCGAIMRVAPIGLFVELEEGTDGAEPRVFTLACESARSTHGHATSTLASGFFALVIAHLLRGTPLRDAVSAARPFVASHPESREVSRAIDNALRVTDSPAPTTPETVERLGGGWIAEEALAVSLFCALRADSFEHGVLLAVNHSGDSDSTGSMTGQLLGALWGVERLPSGWLEQLELRDVIEQLGRDLIAAAEGKLAGQDERYPAW